jgi:hypothetical protein
MSASILEQTFAAMSRPAKMIVTILAAIVAVLFVWLLLFYGGVRAPVTSAAQSLAPAQELNILNAMTPAPASAATVAKNEKTLNTVSNSAAKSSTASISDQDKIGVLLQMQIQTQRHE